MICIQTDIKLELIFHFHVPFQLIKCFCNVEITYTSWILDFQCESEIFLTYFSNIWFITIHQLHIWKAPSVWKWHTSTMFCFSFFKYIFSLLLTAICSKYFNSKYFFKSSLEIQSRLNVLNKSPFDSYQFDHKFLYFQPDLQNNPLIYEWIAYPIVLNIDNHIKCNMKNNSTMPKSAIKLKLDYIRG